METGKSFSGEEAEKDFCGRLFFLAAIFPFSNEKACLGVIAKTDFFYRLSSCSVEQELSFVLGICVVFCVDKLNLLQFAVKVNTTKLDIIFLPDGGGVMYPRIRDLREDRDLKQREVAEYLNCSQQVYSNYELGQRDVPSETLIRLSRFYNVSVDYILSLTDDPKTNR